MLHRTTRAALRARGALHPRAGCRAPRAASATAFPGDAATTVRRLARRSRQSGSHTHRHGCADTPSVWRQTYLRNLDNGAELYLVGTAHVSRKSAEEARRSRCAVR
jgi:hypothetical protein